MSENILDSARLILLTMWLGGAVFFGAVVAPAVFSVLRSFNLPNANEIAGSIVTRSLTVVNIGGVILGVLLLVTFFVVSKGRRSIARIVEIAAILIIILSTAVGHWVITARMRALRAAMILPIDQIRLDDPRRIEFTRLHGYSVNVLGLAMIAALITIVLICRALYADSKSRI